MVPFAFPSCRELHNIGETAIVAKLPSKLKVFRFEKEEKKLSSQMRSIAGKIWLLLQGESRMVTIVITHLSLA